MTPSRNSSTEAPSSSSTAGGKSEGSLTTFFDCNYRGKTATKKTNNNKETEHLETYLFKKTNNNLGWSVVNTNGIKLLYDRRIVTNPLDPKGTIKEYACPSRFLHLEQHFLSP
jgi:hypothetical protein